MKKTFIVLVAALCLSGCASFQANQQAPETQVLIDIARTTVRSFAYVELQRKGVPEPLANATIKTAQGIVDSYLANGKFSIVLDPAAWAPIRDTLVSEFTKLLVNLKADGINLFDEASAKFLAEQVVSLIESNLKRVAGGGK